jgi:two-component system nitrogen regulation response regulator GlnG
LLALAEGGTVLLDEIADVPPSVQVKLLRALEQREVYPVGGTEPVRLDVRLIAATHRDLGALVADGRFREDLFFRLNVFAIHLPPLRERRGDIPALAEHFLRRLAPAALPVPQTTLAYLQERSWPGNVREFRNALEHATVVSTNGPLRPEDFPPPSRPSGATAGERLGAAVRTWAAARAAAPEGVADLYAEFLRLAEPPLFEEVIRRVQGNRWEAGRRLGINRATVRKKLAEYGLAGIGDENEPRA